MNTAAKILILILSVNLAYAAICPDGDFNGDCVVDTADLAEFCGQWLDNPGTTADMDNTGFVDFYDYLVFSSNWKKRVGPVVINEFMASNTKIVDPNEAGEYPDWIELYNVSSQTVNLGGKYLTDDLDNKTKWQIPSGVVIAPGQYLVFWADGDIGQGIYHTSFQLSADGEEIGLYDPVDDVFMDSIDYTELQQVADISYGRYPDGTENLRYFSTPTNAAPNNGAYLGAVEDTQFSHDRGFYDTAFDLNITCATPGAVIRYTTDGSEPTLTNGSVFNPSTPVHISTTSTVRAAAFLTGWMPTNVDTHTYIFGASAQDKALPILSLVKGTDYGRTSVEVLYADPNMGKGFQVDCELTPHSSTSYRLKFKAEFGAASLNYPFFEAAPVNAESATDKFDRIIVRRGKNRPTTWMADPWVANTQIEMSGVGCHTTFMHLYINGSYNSLVNPKERPDAWFTSSYFGGDFEDYFATNHGIERCGGDRPNSACHLSGDNTRFGQMYNMAYAQNLEDPSTYAQFIQLCDVSVFADYTILFWYSGFGDGIDNNWYGGMRNNPLDGEMPPEGFMMFMWDAEASFQPKFTGPEGNAVPWVPSYYASGDQVIPTLWRSLRENGDFKILFADRVYKHLYNDGAITDENAQARWDALEGTIMAGGYAPYQPLSMSGFKDIFISALRSNNYYPYIDPPVFQHGGIVTPGYSLSMSGSSTIYYTLDGTDPRASGGAVAGTQYSGPVILNKSTIVKARVKSGTEWSALHETKFGVGPVKENLRITEVMYHPAGDPNTEYIELRNISDTVTIDPACVSFTRGIDFTFSSMSLLPGEYAVVVKNEGAFESYYGTGLKIAGQFTGSLENAGEKIILQDAIGQTILNFTYKDSWYDGTDGDGFSLTVKEPNNPDPNSWNLKSSWRPSAVIGGSPGADDTGLVPEIGAIKFNELLAHSHNSSDWIELYNTTDEPINIGGWFLSDSGTNLMKYEIADGTVIGPGSYIVFYEDANFGNAADPGCHTPFALSENGETVYLRSGLNGVLTGYIEEEEFGASETDVSFGRYMKSTGTYNFTAMTSKTPGSVNSYPKIGPVVINEIMYNPDLPSGSPYDKESYEYIELYNITGQEVQLYDAEGTPWKLTDGIDFTFPPSRVIPAYGYLLVVKNPAAFAWRVGFDWPTVPLNVQILGPFDGQLNNGGEKIEFSKPGDLELGTLYYISVERITYSDGSHPVGDDPWPVAADGAGKSLSRKVPADYGNDVINFKAGNPSPGSQNP